MAGEWMTFSLLLDEAAYEAYAAHRLHKTHAGAPDAASEQGKAAICGDFVRALCRTRTGDPLLTVSTRA